MFGEKKEKPEKPEKYVPGKTRKGKCQWCGTKGRCSCQRTYNNELLSTSGPQACMMLCGRVRDAKNNPMACGAPLRGAKQICPCEFC